MVPLQTPDSRVDKAVGAQGRLYFMDWLRVVAIMVVFFVHVGKIFDFHTAAVANPERSLFLSVFRDFCLLWVMPMFFILSGGAIFLSQKSGKTKGFVKSRFLRLVVPLLFVGTFIINPVYVYVERIFGGQFSGGFIPWYPQYFRGVYGFGGNFAPLGNGTHLWYLEFLFVYSLILLPLFARSGKHRGAGVLARWSVRFERPWSLLLLSLPVAAISAGVELVGLGGVRGMGGWDPVSYLLFLAYGYLVFSNDEILTTIKRCGPGYLAAAIVLTALLLGSHFGLAFNIPGITRHDPLHSDVLLPLDHWSWVGFQGARGLLVWCWIVALLSLAQRFMNTHARFLRYANEAVLPFYIMHHAVIYAVALYVVPWRAGVGVKFAAISIGAFAIIMAIYEIAVRRYNGVRFFFGMKRV